MKTPVIDISNVTKKFGRVVAVDSLSLRIVHGERVGIVGPNGAGKTTLLDCILGLRRPDNGTVRFDGVNPAEKMQDIQGEIGVCMQHTSLPRLLKVGELFYLVGSFYEKAHTPAEIASVFDMKHLLNRLVESLSAGEQQLLRIACAFIGKPSVIFLDEVTTNLDLYFRSMVLERIEAFVKAGRTLVCVSHCADDLSRLVHRLVVMEHGKLIADGSISTLKQEKGLSADSPLESLLFSMQRGRGNR